MSKRWLAVAAGCALPFIAVEARAAEPCSMPAALRLVCDDPQLRALDGQLVAKERQVLTVTARPATWAFRAMAFRRWTAAERDGDGKPLGREELAARLESRIQDLDNEIGRAAALRPADSAATVLGDRCLAGWLSMNCRVPASGVVRDGDLTIVYQIMTGASENDGVGAGVMLWDASGPGKPKLIGWTFEGVEMRMPQLNAERGLLWVPGTTSGTGEGNADILYQKRGDRWVEIEMESWRDALDARLPDGLGMWHGVTYEFMGDAMGATSDLWRPADANCCPTGGRANLGFKIEGDGLKIDAIQAQIGGATAPWKDL